MSTAHLKDLEAQPSTGTNSSALESPRRASESSDGAQHEKSSEAVVNLDTIARDPAFLVSFDPDDPEDPKVRLSLRSFVSCLTGIPQNWSSFFRWYLVVFSSLFAALASFASSAPAGITDDMAKYFHFSDEVGTLTISVYLLGFVLYVALLPPVFYASLRGASDLKVILLY